MNDLLQTTKVKKPRKKKDKDVETSGKKKNRQKLEEDDPSTVGRTKF